MTTPDDVIHPCLTCVEISLSFEFNIGERSIQTIQIILNMGLLTGFWSYIVQTWDAVILMFPPWVVWGTAVLLFLGYVFGVYGKIVDMVYRMYYDRKAPVVST